MLTTGGTIACKRSAGGLTPVITSKELLSFVPEAREFCTVHTMQLMNIDSTNMQCRNWLQIEKALEENYEKYDGFVITHGTDTLAYTAAALSYLVQNSAKPIIITGAQKPIDMENTDARVNLLDSLRIACADEAYGVNIVFDSKVIAGTRGKKERTKSYNAFASINFPYIATVQDGTSIFYINDKAQTVSKNTPARFCSKLNQNIAVLKLIPSLDAVLLDFMAEHFDAVIIESFGVGGLPSYDSSDYYKAVAKWIQMGKTVVMTTQVPREGSNMTVYEVGRGIKKEFGLIEAYDMTLEATVTKLMWILGQTKDAAEIRKLFYTTVNRDILWKAK